MKLLNFHENVRRTQVVNFTSFTLKTCAHIYSAVESSEVCVCVCRLHVQEYLRALHGCIVRKRAIGDMFMFIPITTTR
jgi:hypothetical protein